MLVLTRKRYETIRVGDNITVTVLRLKGNCVRIGIEAPRETHIIRGELAATQSERTGTPKTGSDRADSAPPTESEATPPKATQPWRADSTTNSNLAVGM